MPAASSNLFDRLTLALVVAIIIAPITYLEVAHPTWQHLLTSAHGITRSLPHANPSTTQPSPAATSTAVHSGTSTKVAAPTKTATTNSYVHLRAGKSVSSAIITNITSGTTVQLTPDADPTWQGASYQGKTGYIFRAYLTY